MEFDIDMYQRYDSFYCAGAAGTEFLPQLGHGARERRAWAVTLAAALAVAMCLGSAGCAGVVDDKDDTAVAADGQFDAAAKPAPADLATCPTRCGEGAQYVLDELLLLPVDASGVAAGFDLDGEASSADSLKGCGFADVRNRFGESGVDNQFAKILKILPTQVGDTLPAALATAISAGGLTLLLEEVGPGAIGQGSPPRAMVVRKGTGQPLLGTDGKLLSSQSFGLEADPILGIFDGLVQHGEGVVGGPTRLKFRMLFISTPLAFEFRHARIRIEPDGQGGIRGEIGGIVTMEEVLTLTNYLGGCDQPLRNQLRELAPLLADARLEPGGPCKGLSMGFTIHGVPAYLFEARRKP